MIMRLTRLAIALTAPTGALGPGARSAKRPFRAWRGRRPPPTSRRQSPA